MNVKASVQLQENSQEADARLLQNILQKTLCLLRHVPDTDILTEANPTLPQKMTAVPMLILPDLLPEKTAVIQRPVITGGTTTGGSTGGTTGGSTGGSTGGTTGGSTGGSTGGTTGGSTESTTPQ